MNSEGKCYTCIHLPAVDKKQGADVTAMPSPGWNRLGFSRPTSNGYSFCCKIGKRRMRMN